MTSSPVSSPVSSPRFTSLPVVESPGPEDNYNNEEENYDNENYDNENMDNEEENNDMERVVSAAPDKTPEQTTSFVSSPRASSVETTIEIFHIPQKGIAAWLAHLERKRKRMSILEKLRSIVF